MIRGGGSIFIIQSLHKFRYHDCLVLLILLLLLLLLLLLFRPYLLFRKH